MKIVLFLLIVLFSLSEGGNDFTNLCKDSSDIVVLNKYDV